MMAKKYLDFMKIMAKELAKKYLDFMKIMAKELEGCKEIIKKEK